MGRTRGRLPHLVQEAADLGPRPQAHHIEVRMGGVGHPRLVALDAAVVVAERVENDGLHRVAAEQVAQLLTVAVPQLGAAHPSRHRATQKPAGDQPARQGQPHDGVGPLPHQVPHRRVVAVNDPTVAADDGGHPLPELLRRQLRPARLVEDAVQLDERSVQCLRQRPAQRGLAGAAVADDRHPLHGRIVSRSPDAQPAHPGGRGAPDAGWEWPHRRSRPPADQGRRCRSRGMTGTRPVSATATLGALGGAVMAAM
jgi:hypothetical protein